MTSLSELKFFTTASHECSYLPDREAITLFADPEVDVDTNAYTALSAAGFRRSGKHLYRPHCSDCDACIPVRIPVPQFQLKRRHKRILKKNSDIEVKYMPPSASDRHYKLYEQYINVRHADGDMFPASADQFRSFLVEGRNEAGFYEFYVADRLIAITVADTLDDGLSAIYTFFDPDEDKRSLGTFAVLWLIGESQRLSLPHLYLGYWIKACQKMSYKADYQPLQMYRNNEWIFTNPN